MFLSKAKAATGRAISPKFTKRGIRIRRGGKGGVSSPAKGEKKIRSRPRRRLG